MEKGSKWPWIQITSKNKSAWGKTNIPNLLQTKTYKTVWGLLCSKSFNSYLPHSNPNRSKCHSSNTLYFSDHAIPSLEYSPHPPPRKLHFSIVPPIACQLSLMTLIRNTCPTPPKYYLTLLAPLTYRKQEPYRTGTYSPVYYVNRIMM